jgi:histone deacetylase 6
LDGSYSKAYAIVRPPGHHAHTELAEGFCFFNNVAIAAANCVTRQKRVMIVDWDIHQGDGTQNTFYDSDQVLLVSLHRRDEGKFYPFREDASSAYIGTGKGLGFNVNIAWDTDGSVVDEVLTENNTVANLGAHEYKLAFE